MQAVDPRSSTRTGEATPLQGIRVLDFSHVFAGPFCTRNLADLGADVAHVETSTRPDRLGATPDEQHHRSAYANRNKRSLTLNLKTAAGKQLAVRLAEVADVVVENFSAGVMRRLGLDYDSLCPINPRLIFVSMSGYGHSGPRHDWTSMNMNLQAYSGLMMATGGEGDPPTAISNSWNDFVGGLHAAYAVVDAISRRNESGRGANLDLSQFECSVATLGPLLVSSTIDGAAPPRMGNRSTHAAPQGCYPCAGEDQWCAIAVENDEQWQGLAGAAGFGEWAAEPRFSTSVGRLRQHDEIDARLREWTRGLAAREVEQQLRAVGVPAERGRSADEVAAASDTGTLFHPLKPPGSGRPILVAASPLHFSESAIAPPMLPPGVGENTREVLAHWLSMSDGEFDALDPEALA